MGKFDIEFRSKCRQRTIGCVKQGFCGKIIHKSEPFALEDSPQRFCDIQMWTIWREKEEEQSTLLPYWAKFPHEFTPVYACIVKRHKCILAYTQRQPVKKVRDFFSRHVLRCGEALIPVVTVNHTEDIEPKPPFRMDIHILSTELPATLWTFPYTSISRANADKKSLKVLSLAFLPEACCQASFAFFTLCLSFSMAMRTASSSEQSIIGFRPRPGRVSSPLMP